MQHALLDLSFALLQLGSYQIMQFSFLPATGSDSKLKEN